MKKSELEEENARLQKTIDGLREEIDRLKEPAEDKKVDIQMMLEDFFEQQHAALTKLGNALKESFDK